ncbi:permease prefix domain 1-containing protein [Deinococcus sonorensis]|uniref:Permease prefix domain 1-containing protein n=1 Tax=Deinococcus sonorensis TaxID=309891 RepID=A0ABV8YBE4_9DEIO
MTPTNRYLKRATRGLWGQKRRDAMMELRGAIEDKVYRHQWCGLSEDQAVDAALRDLGNPATIARELGFIHTGPQVARLTLLLGITTLLGLQAVAQVQQIPTAYTRSDIDTTCQVATPAQLKTATKAEQEQYLKRIASYGGTQAFVQKCRNGELPIVGLPLLRVNDILAALKAGGVEVGDQTDYTSTTSTTPLIAYTGKSPGTQYQTVDIGGKRYISSGSLIAFLFFATSEPLHLSGVQNPVLGVGKAQLQLGTVHAPIFATNVVASLILQGLGSNLPRPGELVLAAEPLGPVSSVLQLAVPGQDGELFAVIQNFDSIKGHAADVLMVRARTNGTVPIAYEAVTPAPRVVTTVKELDAATARKENAVMAYRVNATDLRHITLTQVPATHLQLLPKGN